MTTLPYSHADSLDDKQRQAVESPIGNSVVEAIAGSGKTRCLVHRINNLIEHGVQPHQIMMVTFTRNAAREMIERLNKLLTPTNQQEVPFAMGLPQPVIATSQLLSGTFHSIAVSLLRQYTEPEISKNMQFLTSNDDYEIMTLYRNQVIENHECSFMLLDAKTVKKKFTSMVCSKIASYHLNQCVTLDQAISHYKKKDYELEIIPDEYFKEAIHAYFNYKQKNFLLNYDDMLVYCYNYFNTFPEKLKIFHQRVKHLLVDEYQDINPIQFKLIQQWNQGSLFAIGDKAQAIYHWRGSDSKFITDFESYFPNVTRYTINNNYRSGAKILKAAEAVIRLNHGAFEKIQLNPVKMNGQGEIYFRSFDTNKEAETDIITQLIENHKLGTPYHDQVVLCRSGRQFYGLETLLRKQKMDYRVVGGQSLFDNPITRPIVGLLNIIGYFNKDFYYPNYFSLFPSIGIKGARKLTETLVTLNYDFNTFKEQYCKTSGQKQAIDVLLYVFDQAYDPQSTKISPKNLIQAFRLVFYDQYIHKQVENNKSIKDKQQNLKEKMNILDEFQKTATNYENELYKFLEEMCLSDNDRKRLKSQKESVSKDLLTLSTMHSAKGLEWDIVYLPNWNENVFPSFHASKNPIELQEETNLAYVSLTRAKKKAYVYKAEYSASQYNYNERLKPSPFYCAAKHAIIKETY